MTALVANTISSASLLALILSRMMWISIGVKALDDLFMSMIGLGLLSVVLAISGRAISRGLLIANGAIVAMLSWLAAGLGI
jgi:hypothetical protein